MVKGCIGREGGGWWRGWTGGIESKVEVVVEGSAGRHSV